MKLPESQVKWAQGRIGQRNGNKRAGNQQHAARFFGFDKSIKGTRQAMNVGQHS